MNLETVTPLQLETYLRDYAHKIYAADKAFILADEAYSVLEDNKKSYWATVVESQQGGSNAERERKAALDPAWGEWISGLQEARIKARMARVERDNLVRLWESCRSILSSKNKEWGRQ